MTSGQRVAIPGSERKFEPQHQRIRDADAGKTIEVTAYLRPSASLDWVDEDATRPIGEKRVLSREDFSQNYGASQQDIDAVRKFADAAGLEVAAVDQTRRTVTLRGTVEAVSAAFGAQEIGLFEHPAAGAYRARRGPLTVPAELKDVITGVFGIDERPQADPHFRAHANATAATSYTPPQVAAAYNFPSQLKGAGETVAIIELGGGYSQSDLDSYFGSLNIPPPSVSAVGVDGGSNNPGADTNADGEVMLDIEVVGSVAPGAKIVVYFSDTSDKGFLDAVSTAVHDATNKPSVVSISWGGPEDSWTGQARTQMEQIFTEAAALGVTITAASGDNGSTDGVNDGKQHVDFPASAPHALACGGTSLQVANGKITAETVWNDGAAGGAGGGGISIEFPVPSYQSNIAGQKNIETGKPGRGVPDVAGDADPQTGYSILVDGQQQVIGGTSAVAPLWAGLAALMNESLKKPVGFLQPQLYAASSKGGFRDITKGNNGAYHAGPGWDPCTGLGSPNGAALLQELGGP